MAQKPPCPPAGQGVFSWYHTIGPKRKTRGRGGRTPVVLGQGSGALGPSSVGGGQAHRRLGRLERWDDGMLGRASAAPMIPMLPVALYKLTTEQCTPNENRKPKWLGGNIIGNLCHHEKGRV
jgi:hypothetical protein